MVRRSHSRSSPRQCSCWGQEQPRQARATGLTSRARSTGSSSARRCRRLRTARRPTLLPSRPRRSSSIAQALPRCSPRRPTRLSSSRCRTRTGASSASRCAPRRSWRRVSPHSIPTSPTYSGVGVDDPDRDDPRRPQPARLPRVGACADRRLVHRPRLPPRPERLRELLRPRRQGRLARRSSSATPTRPSSRSTRATTTQRTRSTVRGTGFAADAAITITISDPEEHFAARTLSATADEHGLVLRRASSAIPTGKLETHIVEASDGESSASASYQVDPRRRSDRATRRPATSSARTGSR